MVTLAVPGRGVFTVLVVQFNRGVMGGTVVVWRTIFISYDAVLPPPSSLMQVVSIMGEEVFSFKLSLFPGVTEGEGYSDTSKVDAKVTLRLGCIQIVYLHKFLMSLLVRYYMYTYTHIYMCTHKYTFNSIYLHTHTHLHTQTCIFVHKHEHIHLGSNITSAVCIWWFLLLVASVFFLRSILV